EAGRTAAAARASGRIVMPCHQYRHNPVWMKIKEWLAGGAIGRWHLAEFSVHRTAADPGRVAAGTPWRGTSSAGRGGVLLDHGTHLVYQLLDGARENRVSPLVCGLVRGVRGGARSRRPGRGGATLSGRHPAGGDRRRARVRRRPKRRHGHDPGRRVSRKLQLLLFVGGSAIFGYLVTRIGVARLLADTVRTGWLFVPIVLLYGVVCACNAGAWWLSMADEASRPPFWRAYAITVAGFSLNFITPMVNVGGEPFKIAAVAPWLGL